MQEITKLKKTRDAYILVCLLTYIFILSGSLHNFEGVIFDFATGFLGGSTIQYITFCLKNRINPLAFLYNDNLTQLTIILLVLALTCYTIWQSTILGTHSLIIGLIISQPAFQCTYEAWWQNKQERLRKREIMEEIIKTINNGDRSIL